jgi:ankyrin repeat protein
MKWVCVPPLQVLLKVSTSYIKKSRLRHVNDKGETPYYVAAREGHTAVLRLLEEAGADVAKPNALKQMPVHAAAIGGHHEVLQHLIKQKVRVQPLP